MSGKSTYSIERRVQAAKDYQSDARSLEKVCIALGTLRKKQLRNGLKDIICKKISCIKNSEV